MNGESSSRNSTIGQDSADTSKGPACQDPSSDLSDPARKRLCDRIARMESIANTSITLSPPSSGADVAKDEYYFVLFKQLDIKRLFSDVEKAVTEGRRQEGALTVSINHHESAIAWERFRRPFFSDWEPYNDTQESILFAGKFGTYFKLDIGLHESEEADKERLQKIADLLMAAAGATGLIPVYGSAISAGFSLGAAIAELIKVKLEDDKELKYMEYFGTDLTPLKYGSYSLKRKDSGARAPDIQVDFEIKRLSQPDSINKDLVIVLDKIDFTDFNGIPVNDRLLLSATITAAEDDDSAEKKSDPVVTNFTLDHPYESEKDAGGVVVPLESVVKVQNQVLYDGAWEPIMSFSFAASGIPAPLHTEEWLQVLKRTSELIQATVPDEDKKDLGDGFAIAENAAGALLKLVSDRTFSTTKTGLIVAGNSSTPPAYVLQIDPSLSTWQHGNNFNIELVHPKYGKIVFKLKAKVNTKEPDKPRKFPHKLINGAHAVPVKWPGGAGKITAYGNWAAVAGTTVTIQYSKDVGSTWAALPSPVTFTNDGLACFEFLPEECLIRAVNNHTANTTLTCVVDYATRDDLVADILSNIP